MNNNNQLPPGMFVDPRGYNRKDVDRLVNDTIAAVLDFLSNASTLPPVPSWDGWLPAEIFPDHGKPFGQLLSDVREIFSRSMNPANPRFLGHMDSVPSVVGMLGEFASAALNNNMLSVEMSPMLSRLENACMHELANWFGLGWAAGGTMVSGGTLANLLAIAVARNDALGCQNAGVTQAARRPVILASQAAHTSIQKAAMILGLGTDAVVPIDIDDGFRMRPDALQSAIRDRRAAGEHPFCVVATAGTTTTGSIDPLSQVAAICVEESLWLHVDAAYGGAVILSDRYRHLLQGIEQADSVTFNPQKWLYLPKTCVALLFRDRKRWQQAFRVGAPYMGNFDDLVNLGEVGLQGTRHADVLKLWMSLQYAGKRIHAQLVETAIELTNLFVDAIMRRPYLALAARPQLNLVCFRGICAETPAQQDMWNASLQQHLNRHNVAFFSLPLLQGRQWLRTAVLNPHVNASDITAIFESIDAFHEQWRAA